MGSNYFGGSSSSSSRKGKKSSNSSEKPKQPQRGLGVAQLEKIRLHGQMASSFNPNLQPSYQDDMRVQSAFSYSSSSSSASYGFPSTVMPGVINPHDQYERANIRYNDFQPTTTSSWIPNANMLEAQHYVQPNMTRHPMNAHVEDMHKKSNRYRSHSMRSSSQNSDSSDTQEPDLELRLSL